MKTCFKCKETKSVDEFYNNIQTSDKLCTYCKECDKTRQKERYTRDKEKILERERKRYLKNREKKKEWAKDYRSKNKEKQNATTRRWTLRNVYGISEQEYEDTLKAQSRKCAICGRGNKKLEIDHCHNSGLFRGLLCHQCNVGLGFFEDNPDFIFGALLYILNKAP